ncbi:hypothetical protein BRADI_1g52910v3 [Brachypodium distachyon]|uniref:Uncharacterized protein n=1 Tax=Brachypodium distachyon TaxID=15368 RepID=A0A2K2DR70_BRADI|nr:hypothetical protein BRADI_1g52910v3 [Brachypodium distachyon]
MAAADFGRILGRTFMVKLFSYGVLLSALLFSICVCAGLSMLHLCMLYLHTVLSMKHGEDASVVLLTLFELCTKDRSVSSCCCTSDMTKLAIQGGVR